MGQKNEQPPQPSQPSPQEVFNSALMRALVSQRDGYANAAAEAAAKLAIAQGAVQELQAALSSQAEELSAAKAEIEALRPKDGAYQAVAAPAH